MSVNASILTRLWDGNRRKENPQKLTGQLAWHPQGWTRDSSQAKWKTRTDIQVFCFVFKVLLYHFGWPGKLFVDHAHFELKNSACFYLPSTRIKAMHWNAWISIFLSQGLMWPCGTGWLGIHYVAKDDSELLIPPAFTSWALELQMCANMPGMRCWGSNPGFLSHTR